MMIKMNRIRNLLSGLLILGLLVGFGCSSPSDSDDNDGGNGGSEGGDDPVTYDLTVETNPSEGGSVDPESGTYDEGEEVEITATAADGWEFDGWSGDVTSSDNPLTVTMTDNTSLTAEFDEVPPATYELSVSANPSEGGSVDPETGTFEEGEEVEVTATADDGWEFAGWDGDITSSENPLTVTISENTSLTALFEEIEQASSYSYQIELSDGNYSNTLVFGMDGEATTDYDEDLDEEAPPAPPEGSFYGYFAIDGYNLYNDFRPVTNDRTVWEIHFSPESSKTMTINWDFSSSDHAGSLILVDDVDNASIEVDMEAESTYEVSDSDLKILYVVQQL